MRRLLTLCALLLVGCPGPGAGVTPEATVGAFARALREGDADQAYALMSESYRRRVSLDELRALLRENAEEANATARALSRRTGHAEQEAIVEYGEGEQLRLAREGDEWRVLTDVVDYYDQSTPRAALRSFVRAMERQRYDVVLRLVPAADREGMSVEQMRASWEGEGREEIERLVAGLRASLENAIEEVGDRATMPYGERFQVHFVREDGVWRIEDPD